MKTPISDVSGRMKLGPVLPLAVKQKIGKQSILRTNRSKAALSFSPTRYAEGLEEEPLTRYRSIPIPLL
jgi:hypothetical protein